MAKVYAFPQKKTLPSGMEEELYRVAKDYVEVLYTIATLFELDGDKPTPEEVMDLVSVAFAEGIINAIEDME